MTIVKTEGQHKGEFLISEAPGSLSREVGTLKSGEKVKDGSVLQLSAGKLLASKGVAASETIVGVAYGDYDATGGDVKGVVYIARLAEVKGALLYISATDPAAAHDTDTLAELATNFIIAR